jgi:glycosyltransferase involved in cell wall biosynthesis
MVNPLVSCVMPTKGRRAFIPAAIDCWLKQTYEPRELVIVDEGSDLIEDLIPDDERIQYVIMDKPMNLGAKRNLCCELAPGEIIVHWDDDDWSAPDRIAHQVALLSEERPVTGYGTMLFWDTIKQQAKQYKANMKGYVCGSSLCFTKTFWAIHRFPDKQVASDNAFVYPIVNRINQSRDSSHMVARIHGNHTSPKSGITAVVATEVIPAGFWENEKLRLG